MKDDTKQYVLNYIKICSACGIEKPLLTEFFQYRQDRNVWIAKCKLCLKLIKNKHYISNKKKYAKLNREYRADNAEKLKIKAAEYYQNNKDRLDELNKQWAKSNKKRRQQISKKYYENNTDKKKKYYQENKAKIITRASCWNADNKKHRRHYENEYRKRRRRLDSKIRLKETVSTHVRNALHRTESSKRGESVLIHLPYSIEELKLHLESQFEYWMNWDNYGVYTKDNQTWQIDHIIPQSKLPYNSMNDENFIKCWGLDNLRPLDSMANIKKGNTDVTIVR